jgi:hypothetical protein
MSTTGSRTRATLARPRARTRNAQHVDADKLEAVIADIVNQYRRFELPGCWGSDKVVIADGTQWEAVYILDALLEQESEMEPDILISCIFM